jgi:hypothetical protein
MIKTSTTNAFESELAGPRTLMSAPARPTFSEQGASQPRSETQNGERQPPKKRALRSHHIPESTSAHTGNKQREPGDQIEHPKSRPSQFLGRRVRYKGCQQSFSEPHVQAQRTTPTASPITSGTGSVGLPRQCGAPSSPVERVSVRIVPSRA